MLEANNKRIKELHSSNSPKLDENSMDSYWKQIVDILPISVSIHDFTGYVSLNKYGSELSGYTEEEWVKMPLEERALIYDFPQKPETLIFFDMFQKQGKISGKEMVELEFRLKKKNGEWLWLYTTNSYIFNPLKNDFEMLSAALDVTNRKNHELEIEKLNQELNELLERERLLAQEKQELMEKQIEDKNAELNRLAVYLTEKNNCFLNLKKQAKKLAGADSDELENITKTIIESIDSKINSQNAWNTFEIQFKAANPNYINNLRILYPDLSKMEVKVCTLIKLDLSTKAISSLLNLSTRTVDAHRYNIRKKMNHNNHTQLSQILNSIGIDEK
jgi:PAS domain S-box-containing protein